MRNWFVSVLSCSRASRTKRDILYTTRPDFFGLKEDVSSGRGCHALRASGVASQQALAADTPRVRARFARGPAEHFRDVARVSEAHEDRHIQGRHLRIPQQSFGSFGTLAQDELVRRLPSALAEQVLPEVSGPIHPPQASTLPGSWICDRPSPELTPSPK